MDEPRDSPPIVNVYEIEVEGVKRSLICFLDPNHMKQVGIELRSVVGEFVPTPDGDFDPDSFTINSEFITSLTDYMNEQARVVPALIEDAKQNVGGMLYLLDPRFEPKDEAEPPTTELIGAYTVDETGVIVDDSFHYNEEHTFFDRKYGVSGILADRRFYDWLHPDVGR